MCIEKNYKKLIQKIPSGVELLVVSKTRSIQDIEKLYSLGQRHFGENRIHELHEKSQKLNFLSDLKWHMIGPIQTNKLKKLISIENLYAIHSVDRYSLVEALAIIERTIKKNSPIALFWEFNLSLDKTKHGFKNLDEHVLSNIEMVSKFSNFINEGLMCMGPSEDDVKLSKTKQIFNDLYRLKEKISKLPNSKELFPNGVNLSMGMSHDFEVAISEGSKWLRIGSKIFE